MNKKIFTITTIVNIVYLFVLTFIDDPLKKNYSMFTSSLLGYVVVFAMCLFLSFNTYYITKSFNKKINILSITPIIGCIFPYYDGKGDIISNLHIVGAYIAFVGVCLVAVLNAFRFMNYNYKKGRTLLSLFILVFFFDCLIYLKLMGATSIQQLILLSTYLLMNLYIAYNVC